MKIAPYNKPQKELKALSGQRDLSARKCLHFAKIVPYVNQKVFYSMVRAGPENFNRMKVGNVYFPNVRRSIMRNKLRRPLAFLLSAVMIVNMWGAPVYAAADGGQPGNGLCAHHAAHTDECGYTEGTQGAPCVHEHTEECYTLTESCIHEHTEECYPASDGNSISDNTGTPSEAESLTPTECTHVCSEESGCITRTENCTHVQVNGDGTTTFLHDGNCGYAEAQEASPCQFVCEECKKEAEGGTETGAGEVPEAGETPEAEKVPETEPESGDKGGEAPETGTEPATFAGEEYSEADVAVVNAIIANNGLSATPDDPAGWAFATWNAESPKRITELKIYNKNLAGTLDVSGLTSLQNLDCRFNRLTELNVNGLSSLQNLALANNQLTTLDVNGLSSLQDLNFSNNQLTTLDVSSLSNLKFLYCNDNQLTALHVRGLTNLQLLRCYSNQLTELDMSGLSSLENVPCENNPLTTLTNQDGNRLTVTKNGGGTALITGYIPSSKKVTITATSNDKYHSAQWNGLPEGILSGSNTITVTLSDNLNVEAAFKIMLTEDMVATIPDHIYTGQEIRPELAVSAEIDGKTVVFENGKDFTYSYTDNINAGTATVTITPTVDGQLTGTAVTKTFTIEKSGTELADGSVKTYKGDTETSSFTADDTITVKATPTATGEAPADAVMPAADLAAPTAGQMAVFVNDTQVSEAADAGADGSYIMTVRAADVLAAAGDSRTEITLTAKFVGNGNMADAVGTAEVRISTAVKDGVLTIEFHDNGSGGADADDNAIKAAIDAALQGADKTGITTIRLTGSASELTGWNWWYLREQYKEGSGWDSLTALDLSDMVSLEAIRQDSGASESVAAKLTTLTLPDSLKEIGANAFINCQNLNLTALPEDVTKIGDSAFLQCYKLALTALPEGVTEIEARAFMNCRVLNLTKLPDNLTRIAGNTFKGCTGLTLTELPNRVTEIGGEAFYGCTGLALIKLPDNLTKIGGNAFNGCTGITLNALPDQLTEIDYWAFCGCTGIERLKVPKSVNKIQEGAFRNCTGLKKVIFEGKTAPAFGEDIFSGINPQPIVLVPVGATNYPPELNPQENYDVDENGYHDGDETAIRAILDTHPTLGVDENNPASWSFALWNSESPKRITQLNMNGKKLEGTLDVSGLSNLQKLYCYSNNLTALDVSGLSKLQNLSCYSNNLTVLDASGLSNLQYLSCNSNNLMALDVSGLSSLLELNCSSNQLMTLDVSGLSSLQLLRCDANQLIALDVSGLSSLRDLYCNANNLTVLDVSGLSKLQELSCNSNNLTALDVSGLSKLSILDCCSNNQLTAFTDPSGHKLTVTKTGCGTALITDYTLSSRQAAVTAAPAEKYRFAQWEGLPEGIPGSNQSVTFSLEGDLDVNAVFKMPLTEDLVAVIPDQIYTGEEIRPEPVVSAEIDGEVVVFENGKDFTCSYTDNINAGTASVIITPAEDGELSGGSITKNFTIGQSGTEFAEGSVKTYKGDTETETFVFGETITVKAIPTATGETPEAGKAAITFAAPTPGQMAMFCGEAQVSEAVDRDEDGFYTMTVNTAEAKLTPDGNGGVYILTAKFADDSNMAEAAGTVDVAIGWLETEEEALLSGTQGENDWYVSDVTVGAPEGYTISGDGTDWSSSLTTKEEGADLAQTYYLKNADGQIAKKSVTVNIDKTAPVIESVTAEDVTADTARITVAAADNVSGISDYKLSGEDISEQTSTTGEFSLSGLTPETEYELTVTVTDKAGKLSTETVSFITKKQESVAAVTDADGVVTEYADLDEAALAARDEAKRTGASVTLTLRKDVSGRTKMLDLSVYGGDLIFDLGGHTLSGRVNSELPRLVAIYNGEVEIRNGTVKAEGTTTYAVGVYPDGVLSGDAVYSGLNTLSNYGIVSGGTFTGMCEALGLNAALLGGTFTGHIIFYGAKNDGYLQGGSFQNATLSASSGISTCLTPGYVGYDKNGKIVFDKTTPGTVVQNFTGEIKAHDPHTYEYTETEGENGTYTWIESCPICGAGAPEGAGYTVTIPMTTQLDSDAVISVDNKLSQDKTVTVSTEQKHVTMTREKDDKQTQIVSDVTFEGLSAAQGKKAEDSVIFGAPLYQDDPKAVIPAGTYSGTLTFDIGLQ